jgi:hypothetical protein
VNGDKWSGDSSVDHLSLTLSIAEFGDKQSSSLADRKFKPREKLSGYDYFLWTARKCRGIFQQTASFSKAESILKVQTLFFVTRLSGLLKRRGLVRVRL